MGSIDRTVIAEILHKHSTELKWQQVLDIFSLEDLITRCFL